MHDLTYFTILETKLEDRRSELFEFLRQDKDPDVWKVKFNVNATENCDHVIV